MSKLNGTQKEDIVELYLKGWTQTALADLFDVTRRTIHRVLAEKNHLPPSGMAADLKRKGYKLFTQDQQNILTLCKESGVDAEKLAQIFKAPLLTGDNMIKAFGNMDTGAKVRFLQASRALEQEMVAAHAKAS